MLPITVCSRRLSRARLQREHPGALIIDVTSKGELPWQRFSPFFPVGLHDFGVRVSFPNDLRPA